MELFDTAAFTHYAPPTPPADDPTFTPQRSSPKSQRTGSSSSPARQQPANDRRTRRQEPHQHRPAKTDLQPTERQGTDSACQPLPSANLEVIATRAGVATVTRTETLGEEQVIWADYGSGIPQPHRSEEVLQVGDRVTFELDGTITPGTIIRLIAGGAEIDIGAICNHWQPFKRLKLIRPSSPEPPTQTNGKRKRRYSPKGKASGWIEERQGNLKRKRPSTSFYYCWLDTDGRKQKTYIPSRQVREISGMVSRRCSVDEILPVIRKQPKTHHTQEPK